MTNDDCAVGAVPEPGRRSVSVARYEPLPSWLRWATVAAAMLTLCSCAAAPLPPAVRMSGDPTAAPDRTFRGQSPDPGAIASRGALTRRAAPSHSTPAQMAQASAPLADCPATACSCAGCGSCGDAPGPSDEYLCDGGDYGAPAAVRANYQLRGLEREDTVAHYETVDGRVVVTPSNKVCLYAPRFGAVRRVIDLRESSQALMPVRTLQQRNLDQLRDREATAARLQQLEPTIDRQRMPASLLRERAQAGGLEDARRVAEAIGALAPYANLQIVRIGEITGEERVRIARASLAAIAWSSVEAPQALLDNRQAVAEVSVQSPGIVFHGDQPNNPRLRLVKLADRGAAQQGEEVEFTLRFDNVGDREIRDVTIVDHLTTRLQYVDGSQKSSREARFSTAAAEADSLVLRWELAEPLPPGKGGVIQFRCRVR